MEAEIINSQYQHLKSLWNELNNSIVFNDKSYFHINTTENLIFHFTEVKIESDRNWIYENLVSYFNACAEVAPSIDRHISIKLYDSYLDKLTTYYGKNLGFVVVLNRTLVYLIYFVLLVLSYFLFNIYVTIVLASLFGVLTWRTFKKYTQKKVYSLFW